MKTGSKTSSEPTPNRTHHVEFWCSDATNAAHRFSWGVGMPIVAKSDLSTGNRIHASYLLHSGNISFLFSAPYSPSISASAGDSSSAVIPTFSASTCFAFTAAQGLVVRAMVVEVDDTETVFATSVAHGALPASPPILLDNRMGLAEVRLFGDVVLRYVSYRDKTLGSDPNPGTCFLPGFEAVLSPTIFIEMKDEEGKEYQKGGCLYLPMEHQINKRM